MLTLAIETSSRSGSAAILRDDSVVAERVLDPTVGSARTLAPAIDQLFAELRLRPSELGLIAVSTGPGSFTGLRVGITTAKTLSYALNCPIVGIDTLDAIASQAVTVGLEDSLPRLDAVVDAQRRELFLGRYSRSTDAEGSHTWQRIEETKIISADQWRSALAAGTVVTGPALGRLAVQLPPSVVVAPCECWVPQAAAIGRLGVAAWQSGRRDDLYKLAPTYLRPSYAEEKSATIRR